LFKVALRKLDRASYPVAAQWPAVTESRRLVNTE
jgi:hypothetical protein